MTSERRLRVTFEEWMEQESPDGGIPRWQCWSEAERAIARQAWDASAADRDAWRIIAQKRGRWLRNLGQIPGDNDGR